MGIARITKFMFLFGLIASQLSCYKMHSQNNSSNILVTNNDEILKKNVLILNAYHEGFHWTDRLMNGVKAVFDKNENVELFINYMDSKRCSDSLYFIQLRNLYYYKYKHVKFDAIIATDDHALDFLLNFRDSIFPDVPVVFCGINDFTPSRISNNKLFTGVYESYDVVGTVKLILKIHPNTKEIAIISDATLSGKAFNNKIKRMESHFKNEVSFKYLTNLSLNDISNELLSISKETILIWSIYIRKPDSTVITSEESIRFVRSKTKQPVYCVWDVVGKGVVGGKITDPFYQGKRSAEMVLDILKGRAISKIPVEGSPLVYKFDFNIINEYNISEALLPANSIIINKPISFYTVHKDKIIGIFGLIVFLFAVVIVLIYLVQKQKKAKAEISFKNINLEKAHVLLEDSNIRLTKALDIAKKSKELERANKKLRENEKTQQKLNEELKTLNFTKDRFFTIIAHDLKGPFSTLLGFSNLLFENHKEYDEEERETYIKFILDSSNKTYKLLKNLLTWAQSQTGRIKFIPEKINIELLIDELISLIEESAKKKKIKLTSATEEILFVNADKNMVDTIIRNLVSNAIKFTAKGGKITIKSKSITANNNQKFAEISIEDNGVGISTEIQQRLFKIAGNISTRGTEEETGTGLGLILCKEFVDKHGGEIWVESEVEKGSKFIFTLPLLSN